MQLMSIKLAVKQFMFVYIFLMYTWRYIPENEEWLETQQTLGSE